jgi:hypothetical protein
MQVSTFVSRWTMKEWVVLHGYKICFLCALSSFLRSNVVHDLSSIIRATAPCLSHPRLRWRFREVHLLQSFNDPVISVRRRQQHLGSIAPRAHDVHSSCLATPPSRDALPSAQLERLMFHPLGHLVFSASNENNYTNRFWALAPRRRRSVRLRPGRCQARCSVASHPDDQLDGERAREDEGGTLAVLGFGGSASVADSHACGTLPAPRAARMAELALAWTMSCLNLEMALVVAVAATKYPGYKSGTEGWAYGERWDLSGCPIDLVGCCRGRRRAASWTTRGHRCGGGGSGYDSSGPSARFELGWRGPRWNGPSTD